MGGNQNGGQTENMISIVIVLNNCLDSRNVSTKRLQRVPLQKWKRAAYVYRLQWNNASLNWVSIGVTRFSYFERFKRFKLFAFVNSGKMIFIKSIYSSSNGFGLYFLSARFLQNNLNQNRAQTFSDTTKLNIAQK